MKKCLVCECDIKSDEHCVYDATIWRTSGNYGSTLYDRSQKSREIWV